MIRQHSELPEAVVRGRLLHEALLAEANCIIGTIDWEEDALQSPPVPMTPPRPRPPLRIVDAAG